MAREGERRRGYHWMPPLRRAVRSWGETTDPNLVPPARGMHMHMPCLRSAQIPPASFLIGKRCSSLLPGHAPLTRAAHPVVPCRLGCAACLYTRAAGELPCSCQSAKREGDGANTVPFGCAAWFWASGSLRHSNFVASASEHFKLPRKQPSTGHGPWGCLGLSFHHTAKFPCF